MGSKARESAKAMCLAFVLLDCIAGMKVSKTMLRHHFVLGFERVVLCHFLFLDPEKFYSFSQILLGFSDPRLFYTGLFKTERNLKTFFST